jgi:hypothetical protein
MRTESRIRDFTLHVHIRRLIDEGRLPLLLPDKISAGYGSGSICDGCDQPVSSAQIEYDVEDSGDSGAHLNLHMECYVLWQSECVKRMRERNQQSLHD